MGRAPCCAEEKEGLAAIKKGAWTAEEDEKLVSFIKKNKGHGSWRTLPKLAGLERCGKSCRLRWTNYLRPNIKRGNFSAEEERIILQLHAVVGNKWSSIASHLPGRTDNEVKNHWNTHLKKRLAKMGIDPVTHLPMHFFPPHHHIYGNLSNPQPDYFNNSELQKALLQRSLQLYPSIASHLVQWELARLEAEARQQLLNAHDTYAQNYYASWLQSLLQTQAPTSNLNGAIHAANLPPQTTTIPPSNSSDVIPSQPQIHNSQPYDGGLLKNLYSSSCEETNLSRDLVNYSSRTISKECPTFNIGGVEGICNGYVQTSTTSSIATPDTCSSSDTSSSILPGQFVTLDDLGIDLSSNESYNPITKIDAHGDEQSSQQDSYWNRMLDLLGHVTFESI